MQYIGVTCNVKKRWRPARYKGCSLEPYIEQFGWDNIKHEVLYENLTLDEALKREDELICKARENGTCINANRSGHYTQTEEFKKYDSVRGMAWQKAHPEERKVIRKTWYQKHKDEFNARRREKRKRKKEQNKKSPKPIF